MSFAGPSNYSFFQIIKRKTKENKKEKKVRIEGKIVGVNYFESVYSPMVTASFLQEDTGGTTEDDDTGMPGTLKDTLPVEGFEDVLFRIKTGSGELKFDKKKDKCFVISGSPYNIDTMQKQTAFFPMISKNAVRSANNPVKDLYPEAPISDIVQQILNKGSLKIPKGRLFIEKTKNKLKVIGDSQTPLDTILKLCNKSIPADGGDPGYFFFETQSGYHFKSIQGLIKEGINQYGKAVQAFAHTGTITLGAGELDPAKHPFPLYRYSSLIDANLDNDKNNFKVLKPPIVRRDQDQINALKNGQYTVRVCTIDPVTQNYNEEIITLEDNQNNTFLGGVQVDNNPTDEPTPYCQTYSYILNYDKEDGVIDNPSEYEPRAMMKYGLLHSQLVDIQIPCNVKLEAGQVIKLMFENITQGNKVEEAYNEHRSGFYLILHLCHHFDSSNSFTSLTLARDGYGLYNTTK